MKNEYEYNGFKYLHENPGKDQYAKIIHNKTIPQNLHKYYGLNENSTNALSKGYLFASHPYHMNDVMDSSQVLWKCESGLKYSVYYNYLKEQEDYKNPDKIREVWQKDINSSRPSNWIINRYWTVISNVLGIISLSGIEGNNLMWPHYTGETGFVIKFDSQLLENSIKEILGEERYIGLYAMNYTETLEPIIVDKFVDLSIPFSYITNVKLRDWSYEEEWRIIVNKNKMGVPFGLTGLNPIKEPNYPKENRFVYYNRDAIKEIIFGRNTFKGRKFDLERAGRHINMKFKDSVKKETVQIYTDFLDTLITNYSDKLFHSGFTFIDNEDSNNKLARTKEKVMVKRIGVREYSLVRTDYFQVMGG